MRGGPGEGNGLFSFQGRAVGFLCFQCQGMGRAEAILARPPAEPCAVGLSLHGFGWWRWGGWSGTRPAHHVVFSLENLMPGTRPMRLTIMCRRLLPVSTFTALPIVVLSRLSPFTSVILSPTHRPARSAPGEGWLAWAAWEKSPRLRLSLSHQTRLPGVKPL